MLIVSVFGSKKSGKTTTIEYLIRQLSSRGFRVGSAKHMHHADASIDQRGKDTERHGAAGSKVIVGVSPAELAIIKKMNMSKFTLDTLTGLLEKEGLDILLLEGFHSQVAQRSDVIKIVTAKNEDDAKNTLEGATQPIIAITGRITIQEHANEIQGIPIVNFERDGNLLIDQIVARVRAGAQ